jgi:pSer/pThr/pTyr-binding forkhead associated (FHA) protein
MWKLAIEDDEGKRTLVPLTRDEYTLGRKDGNTIRLTERNVSRSHARLYKKKNGTTGEDGTPKTTIILEDLTSYNGVFVNGLRVAHSQNLAHGDLVQIGEYRLVLQDETASDAPPPALSNDVKQTAPGAPAAHARASALLDRPNRLVMIVGPAPAAEFPLDRERMTIGRAEDASISINHNSVSRIHCEVHALGDGRFEIVDKASSNGVRVNGADLRRGIIEPGDVIELGDVQFKFVGAGQIYRPAEGQPLAALSDRPPQEAGAARRPSNTLPIAIFAAVVIAGTIGAWVYTRRDLEPRAPVAPVATPQSPERAALDEAKAMCAAGDCEAAHKKLETAIAETSALRGTQDFKDVETKWADQLLARADAEPATGLKQAMYQRVSQAMGVDATRRKVAADKLQQLEAIAEAMPSATAPAPSPVTGSGKTRAEDSVAQPPRAEGTRRSTLAAFPTETNSASTSASSGGQTAAKPSGATVDERERALALQGTPDSKVLLKKQLELRVYNGKASDTEIRLLIGTCKDLGDRVCVQAARAALAQKQE